MYHVICYEKKGDNMRAGTRTLTGYGNQNFNSNFKIQSHTNFLYCIQAYHNLNSPITYQNLWQWTQ